MHSIPQNIDPETASAEELRNEIRDLRRTIDIQMAQDTLSDTDDEGEQDPEVEEVVGGVLRNKSRKDQKVTIDNKEYDFKHVGVPTYNRKFKKHGYHYRIKIPQVSLANFETTMKDKIQDLLDAFQEAYKVDPGDLLHFSIGEKALTGEYILNGFGGVLQIKVKDQGVV